MNISEKLSQQDLQQILVNIYNKGQELENIETKELIEEIKNQFLAFIYEED
ncbi:hypothetical protein V7147_24545 [Bacillus sp. JJ1521]|uniref:hypothetical protein n=1 Tax=Bacillus sp. JJ1521 TaxID=3122957 RepID=UPI002FFF520F